MTDETIDLSDFTCEACRAGAPTVTESELAELSPKVPDWEIVDVKEVPRLRRTFTFDGWLSAVEFVNRVAQAAEDNDHHPLVRLEWGKVRVEWWTHKIKGLHRNDFIMAAKTDAIWQQLQEGGGSSTP
jgi:4a-hydroxytetrahydrobiopterin dehydratase